MSRPTRSLSRCCCAISAKSLTVEENGTRLEFRPTAKFSDKPIKHAGAHPRGRDRTIQQHGAGRQRLCRQDLPEARNRNQSRDRDRPVPDRGRGLCQYAGAARQRRTGRRRQQERDRDRACLCRKSGRCLDRDIGLSRSLCRGTAPAGSERTSRRERGAGPLSALHVANRQTRRRDASGARRPATNFPISRRSRSGPPTSSTGSRMRPPAPNGCSTP